MALDVGDWLSVSHEGLSQPCWLFVPKEGKDVPVPLRRRDVSAQVFTDGKFADSKEVLSYVSDVDCTAVFRFPLPPRSAVYRFRAVVGDREVVTKVKPRAEAREEYDLAVQQGHATVHMSQHERGCSVFEVSVGNLCAHEEVVVEFSYLRLLESFGATLEWVHTATWVPPYIGSAGDVAEGVDKVAAAMPVLTPTTSYKLSYDVTVVAKTGAVRSVESPQPTVIVEPPAAVSEAAVVESGAGGGAGHWRVRQVEEVADPSKDLTLIIELEPAAARASGLRVQRTPAARGGEVRTVVLAAFVAPPVALNATTAASEGATPPKAQIRKEIWFVVDCSGSMSGSAEQQAKQAALFFVRDLPADSGVRFNVTCFGSSHKSLYNNGCQLYDTASEAKAVAWIQKHVNAKMGGTKILDTLKMIYDRSVTPGYTREIIFLTDGGISGHEEQQLYDVVTPPPLPAAATIASLTHVLCLGIGHGVHRGLLDGMAMRSHGLAAYAADDASIAAKTAFLKKAATAPGAALRPRLVARGALVRPAPHVLPQRLFPGEPLQVLVDVLQCEPDATLELIADWADGGGGGGLSSAPGLTLALPLGAAVAAAGPAEEGEALGVLHAMAYIGGLLSGTSPLHVRADGTAISPPPSADVVKDAVVRLAVSEHLVTPYTSAVGVSLRRNPADPEAAAAVVEVPLQMPHGRSLFAATTPAHPASAPSFAVGMTNHQAFMTGSFGVGIQNASGHSAAAGLAGASLGAPPSVPWGAVSRYVNAREQTIGTSPNTLFGGALAPYVNAPVRTFGNTPTSPSPAPVLFGSAPMGASRPAGGDANRAPRGGPPGAAGGDANRDPRGDVPDLFTAMFRAGVGAPCAAPGGPTGAEFGQTSVHKLRRLDHGQQLHGPEMLSSIGFAPQNVAAAASTAANAAASTHAGAAACFVAAAPVCRPRCMMTAEHVTLVTDPSGSAEEDDDIAGASSPKQESGHPQGPAKGYPQAAPKPQRLRGPELLSYLNLQRTTEGYWRASPDLAEALGLPADVLGQGQTGAEGAPHSLLAVRPAGVSDDVWATVVVLAALRRVLAAQREVWADMEAKAMGWLLAGAWPAGARSVGAVVLEAVKGMPE